MLSSPTLVNGFETENEAADHSNQPNPKSYTPRKLASDKGSQFVLTIESGREKKYPGELF